MARLGEDDFARLEAEQARQAARALSPLRRASGMRRNGATQAWLTAGDNLAEKAIAALDLGDDARAAAFVHRIAGLPQLEEDDPESGGAGPMALHLLLSNTLYDPDWDDVDEDWLSVPLALLPELDEPVATFLRHVLATLTETDLTAAEVRRIRAVVDLRVRFDPPFGGLEGEALESAMLGALRLVLRLRAED